MHVGSVTYWFSSEANHVKICLEGHAITGDVRHDLLRYTKKTKDVEIVKLETRYMKSREKGLGLKLLSKSSSWIHSTRLNKRNFCHSSN
jgi:hypothetical protein